MFKSTEQNVQRTILLSVQLYTCVLKIICHFAAVAVACIEGCSLRVVVLSSASIRCMQ